MRTLPSASRILHGAYSPLFVEVTAMVSFYGNGQARDPSCRDLLLSI